MSYFRGVFKDKTVLVTGHTGFKGSWLSIWLKHIGANVIGLSSDIPSNPSNYVASTVEDIVENHRINICDKSAVKNLIEKCQPDFVFHLAAQALVRYSYSNPLETFETNSLGTANILDALKNFKKPVVAIMITSDKAYDNVEWVWGYRETDRIGGKDPYSASKGMAELVIRSYVESFFNSKDGEVRLGVTRAGNVIGGGDWAEDRIVPDCMASWSENKIVDIRSPNATRPWQHVLEPLSGYILLACELFESPDKHGESYNFGPSANQNYSVSELIDSMSTYWDNVRWNNISKEHDCLHEAGLLKLNCDKALFDLNWLPTLEFDDAVRMTVEWYKTYYQNINASMFDFSVSQIKEYTELAEKRNIVWAKK